MGREDGKGRMGKDGGSGSGREDMESGGRAGLGYLSRGHIVPSYATERPLNINRTYELDSSRRC